MREWVVRDSIDFSVSLRSVSGAMVRFLERPRGLLGVSGGNAMGSTGEQSGERSKLVFILLSVALYGHFRF